MISEPPTTSNPQGCSFPPKFISPMQAKEGGSCVERKPSTRNYVAHGKRSGLHVPLLRRFCTATWLLPSLPAAQRDKLTCRRPPATSGGAGKRGHACMPSHHTWDWRSKASCTLARVGTRPPPQTVWGTFFFFPFPSLLLLLLLLLPCLAWLGPLPAPMPDCARTPTFCPPSSLRLRKAESLTSQPDMHDADAAAARARCEPDQSWSAVGACAVSPPITSKRTFRGPISGSSHPESAVSAPHFELLCWVRDTGQWVFPLRNQRANRLL